MTIYPKEKVKCVYYYISSKDHRTKHCLCFLHTINPYLRALKRQLRPQNKGLPEEFQFKGIENKTCPYQKKEKKKEKEL